MRHKFKQFTSLLLPVMVYDVPWWLVYMLESLQFEDLARR